MKLLDSTELLGKPAELASRLRQDGYLFFRGLFPKRPVEELCAAIQAICSRHGWDPAKPVPEGSPEWKPFYEEVQKLELFHAFGVEQAPKAVLDALFQEEAFCFPNKILRYAFPGDGKNATAAHQDFVYVQGSVDVLSCWVALMEIPESLGGLALRPGSHKAGVLPLEQLKELPLPWASTDYQPGDAVFFHSLTVHGGRPNQSRDRIRLSTDFRYAGLSHSVSDDNKKPHWHWIGPPFDWEHLDAAWSPKLRRYWERLPIRWVAHRPDFFI